MKNFFILLSAISFTGFAQEFSEDECPAQLMVNQLWEQSESRRATGLSYEQAKLQNIEQAQRSVNTDRAVITIPVVFHVVLTTANQANVTDQDILDELAELNLAYSNASSNSASIRTNLWTGTDAQIQFCLAQRDPDGNATTGIERRDVANDNFTLSTNMNTANAFKNPATGLGAWDRERYLNVWITGFNGNVAGFAYPPLPGEPLATLPAWIDGAAVNWQTGMNGVTLAHEIGHVLGLDHTFGLYSCASDDGFADTPDSDNAARNYNATGCGDVNLTACGNTVQYENFMDYSDCGAMFTQEQVNYMTYILLGVRASLQSSDGCTAPIAGEPGAAFNEMATSTDVGGSIIFNDASTNTPTAWEWTVSPPAGISFVNGTSSTTQNAEIQFTFAGTYTISLTATNANGSTSVSKLELITVYEPFGTCHDLAASDYRHGFEDSEDFTEWTVTNVNTDMDDYGAVKWNVWSNALMSSSPFNLNLNANGGTSCAVYRYNINQTTPANDYIITPCMSFNSGDIYQLDFYYGCNSASYPERLKVVLLDYQDQVVETVVDLGTINNTSWTQSTTQFSPTTTGDYRVAFHAYSLANKDALYLDDINISNTTTSSATTAKVIQAVYPNPATEEVNISFANPNNYTIEILDLSGKLVMTHAFNGNYITLPVAKLQSGSYLLRITSNEGTQTESIIVR